MSRIGNNPIKIPEGVSVTQEGNLISVKGKLGELSQDIDPCITISILDNTITCSRDTDSKDHRSKHGLFRSLISNMVEGVSNGFTKKLELRGVGKSIFWFESIQRNRYLYSEQFRRN